MHRARRQRDFRQRTTRSAPRRFPAPARDAFHLQSSTFNASSGFTLVELLVVIAIFSILSALTVYAFTGNQTDRVGASASTFRSMLEGAKSRAVKSGQVRGLRLIPDPNDPRIITSLAYVGTPEFDEGECVVQFQGGSWRLVNVDLLDPTNHTTWNTLDALGLLRIGARVEVPRGSGRWYRVTDFLPNTPPTNQLDAVVIAGHYQPSVVDGGGFAALPNAAVPYRLELTPTLLAGADPVLLTPQTCIDLDGSVVPGNWRDSSGNYAANLEILFSPRGTVVGSLEQAGVVHFRIANIGDVLLARGNGIGLPLTTQTAVVVADPERGHRAISLFTQTGGVVVTEIDPISAAPQEGFNNETVDSLVAYRFALRGKEAK